MNKRISLADFSPLMKEVLDSGGEVRFQITGISMMPMLRHRTDSVLLVRPEGRLAKYDIPLYRRADGKFVLHRILKVRNHDYVVRGDNQLYKEYGVTDDMIIGRVKGFYRDGIYKSCEDREYLHYVRNRCRTNQVLACFAAFKRRFHTLKK